MRWLRPAGIGVEHVLGQRPLRVHVLHVDHRRSPGDGDRLFDAAHRRSAFTVAVNVPVSSMPSRLTVLNPGA